MNVNIANELCEAIKIYRHLFDSYYSTKFPSISTIINHLESPERYIPYFYTLIKALNDIF